MKEAKYCLFDLDRFQIVDLPYGSREEMLEERKKWPSYNLEVLEVCE